MTVRKNSKARKTLDDVLDNLPEQFLNADVVTTDGAMVGLRDYTDDLSRHLRQELGLRHDADVQKLTAEAMEDLGIPGAEWYAAALQERG